MKKTIKKPEFKAKTGWIFLNLLLFTACTLESPVTFVKQGVSEKDAVSFLETFKPSTDNSTFEDHIQALSERRASDFNWSSYWSSMEKKQLYKKLNNKQLDKTLKLSQFSCTDEDQTAFISVLLQLAEQNPQHLYFKKYLTGSGKTCAVFIPNSSLRNIVHFLSNKRTQKESALFKKDIKAGALTNSYPYTQELFSVVAGEWSLKKQGRAWGNILSLLDRSFWPEVRWLFYQKGQLENIKTALKIEADIYESPSGLDQDILFMFKGPDMKSQISASGYSDYLSQPKTVNWQKFWGNLAQQQPQRPLNLNNDFLLSFYRYSCEPEALKAYTNLLRRWGATAYRTPAEAHCEKVIRITQRVTHQLEKPGWPDDSSIPGSIEEMNDLLSATKNERSTEDLIRLLHFYDKFQLSYPNEKWQELLNQQFSLQDWLSYFQSFRKNYNTQWIKRVLEMQSNVYQGPVPFLSSDIFNVVVNSRLGLSQLTDEYGYLPASLNNTKVMEEFWNKIQNNKNIILSSPVRWKKLFKYGSDQCHQDYLNRLFKFLSDNNQEELLFNHFNFDTCPDYFINVKVKKDFFHSRVRAMRQNAAPDLNLYWELIHSFSLYVSHRKSQPDIEAAVFRMNAGEWENIFKKVIPTLKSPIYRNKSAFLTKTMKTVDSAYPNVVDSALCEKLPWVEDDPAESIRDYDLENLMYLLNQINWNNKICKNLPKERLNMFAFALAYHLFESVDNSTSPEDYISSIWSQAVRLIDFQQKLHQPTGFTVQFIQLINRGLGVSEPDLENSEMSHRAFQFYFSSMILSYMNQKAGDPNQALEILEQEVWLPSDKEGGYRAIYKEMLINNAEDYSENEPSLNQLKRQMNLI